MTSLVKIKTALEEKCIGFELKTRFIHQTAIFNGETLEATPTYRRVFSRLNRSTADHLTRMTLQKKKQKKNFPLHKKGQDVKYTAERPWQQVFSRSLHGMYFKNATLTTRGTGGTPYIVTLHFRETLTS